MGNLMGVVYSVGPHGSWHGIQYADRQGKIEEFFGSRRRIHYDILGRKALYLGCPVSFTIGEAAPSRGQRRTAVHIRNEDPSLKDIDPDTWREFGRIKEMERDWRG